MRNAHLQQKGKLTVEFQKPALVTESSFQQLIKQYYKFSWQTTNQFNLFCWFPFTWMNIYIWTQSSGCCYQMAYRHMLRHILKSNIWKSSNHILLSKVSLGERGPQKREKSKLLRDMMKDVRYSTFSVLITISREQNRNWPKSSRCGKALMLWIQECHFWVVLWCHLWGCQL